MSLFTTLKNRLFQRRLVRELGAVSPPPPAPACLNPDNARHTVLLFPADSAEERRAVDRWRDAHRRTGHKIEALGYFANGVGSTSFDFRIVSVKDCNWYGAPTGEVVREFLGTPCDLLIRLGPGHHPELDYLAALKAASLRVGPLNGKADSPYHLQFDAGPRAHAAEQLATIGRIFTFTNATATP